MDRIENNEGLAPLAWKFNDSEIQSIIFAAEVYVNNIENDLFPIDNVDPLTVHEAIEAIHDFTADLKSGSQVILDRPKQVAWEVLLPYLDRLYSGITSKKMLKGVCRTIGVDVEKFVEHATTIESMLCQEQPDQLA